MKNKKEKILSYFQSALDAGISDQLMVSTSKKDVVVHSVPRLLIILEGMQDAEYFDAGKGVVSRMRFFGDARKAQYCSSNGYLYNRCIPNEPSKGISLSYYPDFIRYMYVEYNGVELPPTQRDIVLHSNAPLPKSGMSLLKVLDEIAESADRLIGTSKLLEALLEISIDAIRRDGTKKDCCDSHTYRLWHQINNYIRSHFNDDLTRDKVAKAFYISPTHLSHLFKRFGDKDFTATLEFCRLNHATMLLRQTNLSLKEIAEQCNYKYASYFIRRFKNRYGMTPAAFRSKKATDTENATF